MPIPESQLDTWSHQGSIVQSAETYRTIKTVLGERGSPYAGRSFTIFLQGSYGNDTNVFRDSDVDIVIRLDDIYYADTDALGPESKVRYERDFLPATYSYQDFKAGVLAWLRSNYGAAVTLGSKAISIEGSGSRRDADVLVCARYRRYRSDSAGNDNRFDEGVCFFRTDTGRRVGNFPKQHADNCTTKHQGTRNWFKPTVRVFKNLRNRMVDDGVINSGLAPSYFIEGMLWNVPASSFGTSYSDTFVNVFNWINSADKASLACANDLHWLVRTGHEVCWPDVDFEAYLAAVARYWGQWSG